MKPSVHMEDLEAIIRSRICAVCTDRTVEATCGLEDPNHCSLFQLFPLVTQAILATESEELEPYVQAIHEHVCSVCLEQALDGSCRLRNQAHCALDAYMPLIIESIEEALGRKFSRTNYTGSQPVI